MSVALMYFAKVNVNHDVYKLYEKPELLGQILDRLLVSIDQQKRVKIAQDKEEFWVKFISLEKDIDRRYIIGRVVKIFEDDIEIYNSAKDDVDPLPTKELARSVTFYFDLRTELVAFTTSRYFGHLQFCAYFKELLNAYSDEAQFEVFLEKNADELKERLYKIKKITRIDITLIPPNPNSKAFARIFPQDTIELQKSRITKIQQSYLASGRGEGIDPKTDLIDRAVIGVSEGYGDMTAYGKNEGGIEISVSSSKDAPHKRFIHRNMKDSLSGVMEAGRAFIQELISKRLG